jgi:hypothetical protein
MWLIAHRKASTKVVPDGETFNEVCPTCRQRTRFVEVVCSEKYGVFFAVDIFGDEERAFRCTACGDIFDLKEDEPEMPAPKREPVPAKPAVDRAAIARMEKKIDDELAELKRRLGR